MSASSAIRRFLVEPSPHAARYARSRGLFIRALGAIYVIAFLSWDAQLEGLVGARGILPAADFLARAKEGLGAGGWHQVPTVLWWTGASDAALHNVARSGAASGALVVLGFAPLPLLAIAWALYLSLASTGGVFMHFQWDSLLLEAGLLGVLASPANFRLSRAGAPSLASLALLRFLVFRLMFLSGVVKLTWGDETWTSLRALDYHFFTQPIPGPASSWAHHLSSTVHQAQTAIMFAIECVAPFFFFAPRRLRHLAAASQIALQLGILATGNYGFFNALTIVLCIPLLDDELLARAGGFLRIRPRPVGEASPRPVAVAARAITLGAIAAPLLVLQAVSFGEGLFPRRGDEYDVTLPASFREALGAARPLTDHADEILATLAPARSLNAYGLFRSMTTTRPEITVEGSLDGATFRPYRFKWKPGPLDRRPGVVEPHMPRLDWQMWFAGLAGRCDNARWYLVFARRLLEGSPAVTALLDDDPFDVAHGGAPPKFIRSSLSDYRFAEPDEHSRTGAWWTATPSGSFCPTLTLEDGQLTRVP